YLRGKNGQRTGRRKTRKPESPSTPNRGEPSTLRFPRSPSACLRRLRATASAAGSRFLPAGTRDQCGPGRRPPGPGSALLKRAGADLIFLLVSFGRAAATEAGTSEGKR